MENINSFRTGDIGKSVRKKRSILYRRPQNESQSNPDYQDSPSLSSTPPMESGSKASSDDNAGQDGLPQRKELNINQCSSRASYSNLSEAENLQKISDEDGGHAVDHIISAPDDFSGASWKGMQPNDCSGQSIVVSDGTGNEHKFKKVKLKVGGVTRTIHAKPTSDFCSVAASSSGNASGPGNKLIIRDKTENSRRLSSSDKGIGLRGIPWKDFSKSGFIIRNTESLSKKMRDESFSANQSKYEAPRKSKRVSKRRSLGNDFDEGDSDDEIRYLEKLKTSKTASIYIEEFEDEDESGSRRQNKKLRVLHRNTDRYEVGLRDESSSRSGKESRKTRSQRASEDTDYMEEEESVSDGELEPSQKKQKKELVDITGESKRTVAITTRQRALQSGRDVSSSSGASFIEFPNGLPPAPPRKQKEQLSEVEQQLKRVEAAQRRRMQNEKAARELEAEAIRKILGQDSSRKKREAKVKKRQEEIVQGRNASFMTLSPDAVRWVIGPSGTVVTFPDEIGLPTIFEPRPCSYPPPREKCAGPSCTNTYKYRDSKSKLPLCSLQCYKAIQEKMQPLTAC